MADYQQYLAILDLEPHNTQALAELERAAQAASGHGSRLEPAVAAKLAEARRVHQDRGDLELALRLFDLELQAEADQARQADLLFEKGKLYEEDLLNEDAAVECYHRVLELRPEDPNAQQGLAFLDMARANWEGFVKKFLDEAKASTERQLTTNMYLSAAETYARYRRDAPEVEVYLRRALEVEPRNRRAAMHLERLLRGAGRWADLAKLLEQRVDAAAVKEERVLALLALADLAKTRLADAPLELSSMKRILAQEPGHPRALQALGQAYTSEENWSGLAKLYEGALKQRRVGQDPAEEMALLIQVAMLHWKQLRQLDVAEEYFRRLRKIDAAHPAMLDFYREYHKDRGEGQKLLQVLAQAQKAEALPERRAALAIEIASFAETEVRNPEKAIDSWKAILRQNPRNPEARTSLKRLYQKTEKWNALLELLKEEIEALPVTDSDAKRERVERLQEVVAIYRDCLNLDVMVINTYNNILALVPDHEGALDALSAKYEQLGRWNDLIAVLSRKADLSSTPRESRIALLRRVASLWTERFGNHAQAVKPLEDLLATDPTDPEALGKLKEIYVKRRQWRALLDLMAREEESLPSASRRAHLGEMAKLAAEKLGDARAAIAIWNRILASNVRDAEALAQLAALYEREKRYLALAEVLHRQKESLGPLEPGGSTVAAAVVILEKLGTLYADKLGASTQAQAVLGEILLYAPGHAKAFRTLRDLYAQAADLPALEALFGKMGAWDELYEVLHSVADRLPEPPDKLAVLLRIATLCGDRSAAPEKAAKVHERILVLDPENVASARALVPIYKKGEKWARLLSTYETLLFGAASVDAKLELLLDIRKLCEEKLGSKALAFQWCARAYEIMPDDEALLHELERLGAEADAWTDVADILSKRAGNEGVSPAERLRLWRELGRIFSARLHKLGDSRAAWEKVLTLAPDDPEAMGALEEMATHEARWPDLLAIYRRRAELAADLTKKEELLFKMGFLLEEHIENLDQAAELYEQILAMDAGSVRALRALGKVQGARGDAAGLARVLELELGVLTEAEERVALLCRLGALYEDKLGQRKTAFERYRAALGIVPTHRATQAALEKYLALGSPERVAVAELLAPVFERSEDATKLAGALEILRSAGGKDDATLALDRRLFGLYARKLKDSLNAYEVGTRILYAAPEDAANRGELQVLAAELAAYDDLAVHLEKVVSAARDPVLAPALLTELLAELAEIYEERLDQRTQAEAAWHRVLELDKAHDRAYDALERLLRGAERWQDLRVMLERREENTPDSANRQEILTQICDLFESVLDDADGTIRAYRRVLDLEPTQARAYKALDRLYGTAERWAELEELLSREVACAKAAPGRTVEYRRDVTTLLWRRAELRAEKLDDPTLAFELGEEVLERDAHHAAARKLLEGLFGKDPDLTLRIARLLGPLYQADELWKDLVRMLRGERELATQTSEIVELLARIATLTEERLGDEPGAFHTWAEALTIDPADHRSRGSLERLARRLDRWGEAALSWERALVTVAEDDLSLRATLLAELAAIYDRCLNHAAKATDAYRRLLDVDPGNVTIAAPAAEALERLYEEAESWPELVLTLRRQAEWSSDAERRLGYFYRVAKIQEDRLADVASAIATWHEVLAEDGENRPALDALERLHQARGESQELVEILRRRIAVASEPQVRRSLLLRIAALNERGHSGTGLPRDASLAHESRSDFGGSQDAILAYLEILDFLPGDLTTLTELSRLYRSGERWHDLLEIDQRRLALASDPLERTQMLMDLGALLSAKLSRPEEGLEHFQKILEQDPLHVGARSAVEAFLSDGELKLRAAEILEPLYVGAGEHEKRVGLYELMVTTLLDPRERMLRLVQMGQIQERHLVAPDLAFDAYARAARRALGEPELVDLLSSLQRIALERDRILDLVSLYRELGPEILDGELQRRLYLDIADLARGKVRDLGLARDYYRRVLDAHPDDARALGALEALYRETEEHEPLRDILSRKAELVTDLDARRDALVDLAALCEEKLDRAEDAVLAWEQVLELLPADLPAIRALERLYSARERWAELAELYEKRMGFAEDLGEAVELRYRLGELFEKQLRDPDRAVENYVAALSGDAQHAQAIVALERYLEDPATSLPVAQVLEPIYIARHAWPKLIRITEIRLDAELEPAGRLALTRRIARLHEEQLEDLEGAFRWYGKVFREGPEERATRSELVRLATILSRWDGLAGIYQDYLDDESGDTDASREVARALAEIYDRRLGDVDRARAAYRRVLASLPEDADAFAKLEAMLSRASRWSELVETYQEGIEAAGDALRRRDLYARTAQVEEAQLGARGRATSAYRAMLDLYPDDEMAIAELDRLYLAQELWHELAELLVNRIDRAPTPAGECALRMRLAGVLEENLDEVGSAIDQLEQVLSRDQAHAPAIASLERLVLEAEHRARIAQLLEPVYRAQDFWQKLVVILDARLEFVDDRVRRVEMLREIARLHETRGGAMNLAWKALSRAWKEDISDESVYGELEGLTRKLGTWDALCETLELGIEGQYDYDLVARLLSRMGTIHEECRRDRPRAIEAWKRVLEVKDDDETALLALERLYAAEGRFADLIAVLERRVELSPDGSAQKELLRRIAGLYEEAVGRRDRAIGAWRQILGVDAGDASALDALERLFAQAGEHRSLVDILGAKIELASGDAQRSLRFYVAQVLDEELHETFEAISHYQAALEANPHDGQALEALDRLYVREKSWVELVDILDRRAALIADLPSRAELMYRAARVIEVEQSEVELAIVRYSQILEATPHHGATRGALDALTKKEETLDAAAAVLEPVYRADLLWDKVVELFERRLAGPTTEPQMRRELFAALADVHEGGRQDPALAFAVWARFLRDENDDEGAKAELWRLALARGRWDELAALYEDILADAVDTERLRSYALTLARIYEEALGDLDKAKARYRRALETGGEEQKALAALDRICEHEAKWTELCEVLAKEAEIALRGDEQATFLYRLGDIREKALGDATSAIEAFREVLDREPQHLGARSALERLLGDHSHRAAVFAILEPLYDSERDHARLADLLESKLTVEVSAAERASLLCRMATIAEKELADPVRALGGVGRWLFEDPVSEEAARELERLAKALGRWAEAAAYVEDVLRSERGSASPEVAEELSVRLGRIALEELGDLARAEQAYQHVLKLHPHHGVALEALDRIYRTQGDAAQLVTVLWQRGESELESKNKRGHFVQAARLYEESLGDHGGATRAWQEVLDLNETDADAHAHLAAIYERTGQWAELVEILETEFRVAEDRRAHVHAKRRIAEVHGEKLGNLDHAVDAWHDVIDLLPEDDRGLAALADIHRRRGDWLAVQEMLVRRLSLVASSARAGNKDEQVGIYLELAKLAEVERKSLDEAVGYLHQILDVDNAHAEAYQGLERLLAATERWHELVDVLVRHAEVLGTLGDTRAEVSVLARAADVWDGPLGNSEGAAEILEKILHREPGYVPALTRLSRIYEGAGDWERCGQTLERALALGAGGRDAADLHYRLGCVAEAKSGNIEEAVSCYERALSYDGTHLDALTALERVVRERADFVTLAGILARREALESEPEKQLAATLELAEVFRSKLNRPGDALPLFARALERKPQDSQIAETLAELYAAEGRSRDAEALYRRLADMAKTSRKPKDMARFHQRLGSMREAAGDLVEALRSYEEAYRVDPSHTATTAGLGRIYFQQADWEKARKIYRSMLLTNIDPQAGVTKAEVFLQLGLIHAKLGEGPKAKGMYERGLELEPTHKGLHDAMAQLT